MRTWLAVLIVALGAAGCAGGPGLREYGLSQENVELDTTPFYPQSRYQCGPAALATVLGASGLSVTPEELAPRIYLPERRGSLQAEIIAATRGNGRIPYVLTPDIEALLTEVASGMPVLVMQNLGLRLLPRWHYAVVIGFDTRTDFILLRSGTKKRMHMNRVRFEATWNRADHWAMIAALPSHPPATAHHTAWIQAASDAEELGLEEMAVEALAAATRRWPKEPLAWQALANTRYSEGNLQAAEIALRQSLQLEPSAAAHNNLAHILHERGCPAEAMAEITRAEASADAIKLTQTLASTRAAIVADRTTETGDRPIPSSVPPCPPLAEHRNLL